MANYESVPAVRLEASVKVSVARVGEVIKSWNGPAAVLGGVAHELLGEVHSEVVALNKAQKKEGLEAAAAERAADKEGERVVELVRQFHARANAHMWAERAKLAAQGLGEDANAENFALSQWLERLNPSAFAALNAGQKASFLESINTRKAQILTSSPEDVKLSEALEQAAISLRKADKAETKEEAEAAQAARNTAQALAGPLATKYQAARDALSAGLRLTGQLDELDRLIPSFWDTIESRRRARNPGPLGGNTPPQP
jgi:hypothetical protein